ncbi:nuclear transport factor 2 family protein [Micromonospora sp. BQ11]|uniref:nuclear transport factor 2 family protein n=1 Tax=Micromonospora sp. BQ11 TaxID=3452212 RepID=UPI003F8B14D3
MTAAQWIAQLGAAWRQRDPLAIGQLFTPDAAYHQGPFGTPHRGPAAIAAHWEATLSRQVEPRIWFGEPVQAGDRASVEWWCIVLDPATRVPRTASGSLALRFAPDGRCASFREYWHTVQETAYEPPAGWFGGSA